MIVGRIQGGLGNQLFQYAYLYAVSQRKKQIVKLDTTYFKGKDSWPFRLDLFNISTMEIVNNDQLPKLVKFQKKRCVNRIIRIFPLFWIPLFHNWRYYKECRLKYLEYAYEPIGENIYIDGYWQTCKYFEEFSDEIRQQLTPNYEMNATTKLKCNEVTNCCSVSVHIRRGDYLKITKLNSQLYLLTENYYRNAINEMKKKVVSPIFYFFSDDIDWAVQVFGETPEFRYIKIVSPTSDIDELIIMSKCKHHIVANSSYSWWGAWLNPSKEKIVIAPSKRYGNNDILPNNYIKIDI